MQTSITSIDIDQDYSIEDQTIKFSVVEEEKTLSPPTNSLKGSVDIINHEGQNDSEIHSLLESIESGLDILTAAVEAIERRSKYKHALEVNYFQGVILCVLMKNFK